MLPPNLRESAKGASKIAFLALFEVSACKQPSGVVVLEGALGLGLAFMKMLDNGESDGEERF